MKEFRIWAKEKWSGGFQEINFVEFQSIRSEEKGLGAGVAKILLTNYSPFIRDTWEQGRTKPKDLTNWWIFVQAVDLLDAGDRANPNYKPYNNYDPSFVWWGFCGEFTRQIQNTTGDSRGSLNLYEIGHWFAKQKIIYPENCSNGFNPIFDSAKGIPVGNKDIGKTFPDWETYGFEKNGRTASIDPSSKDNFFTVKEAINHIIMRSVDPVSSQFEVYADWSGVDVDGANSWLKENETVESYQGKSLADALDEVLDTFTWTYKIEEGTENILVSFKDRYLEVSEQKAAKELTLDASNESFVITAEQQVYDHIEIEGDRICFFNSITTYTPFKDNKSIGIFPKWTDQELKDFVSPLSPLIANKNLRELEKEVADITPGELPENDENKKLTDNEENEFERRLEEYKSIRQSKHKKPYQDYVFGYCYPENPLLGGECLATWDRPGEYDNPKDTADGVSKAIACYPKITLQKPLSTATSTENILTKKPSDLILGSVDIEDELRESNGLLTHQTPICTEMRYEETGVEVEQDKQSFIKSLKLTPTFYYRTVGKQVFYGEKGYLSPLWLDGTKGGNGLMSSKITFDWDGVTLDCDEPEVFGCYYPDIYRTATATIYNETIKDMGHKRNEWNFPYAGASKYDYYHRRSFPDWLTVTHWGRFVFSFGSYSSQRIKLEYGLKSYTKSLKISDDGYKMAIIRRGFVSGVGPSDSEDDLDYSKSSLKYNRYDVVLVNDMPKLASRMTQLWNYWSRPKSSVKLSNAIFNTAGALNRPLGVDKLSDAIGMYIGTIVNQDGKKYEVNSYVSSIEYDMSADQPRILIQTEYPDSPKSTRTKTVAAVWKKRKNDWRKE
jgi:hypothetical protein